MVLMRACETVSVEESGVRLACQFVGRIRYITVATAGY